MAVEVNDSYIEGIINFSLGLASKGVEFGFTVLSTLVDNWAPTFAVILIVGGLLIMIKKSVPSTSKYLPKLN